jgi:hypothetical protein
MNINKKIERNKLISKKKCQYENCDIIFEGTGHSKYCLEHRKKEYHQKIIKNKEEINQIINHNEIFCPTKLLKCSLEKCGTIFQIILLPNIKIYPKYCLEHRNEFKRKQFLK